MKIVFISVLMYLSVGAQAQQDQMVLYANPWFSTKMKNVMEHGEISSYPLGTQVAKIYTPGTYVRSTSPLTISDAVSLSIVRLRQKPLLLHGLNIVESKANSVAVVRFSPRYWLFGKTVCRVHRFSNKKLLRMSKRMPVQVFRYT